MKFSAQTQQVPRTEHPFLSTMHGWGSFFIFLAILYGMSFSHTRHKRRDQTTNSLLIEDTHPAN